MAAPRKVFRIEEMIKLRHEPQADEPHLPPSRDLIKELGALRGMLADAMPSHRAGAVASQPDMERLASALHFIKSALSGLGREHAGQDGSRSSARITDELQAVMEGSEQATQKILAAAEDIDLAANNLSAALKNASERGLAHDIRDRVVRIFEACNFQDLTSQRVAKVMAALGAIESEIAQTLAELSRARSAPPVHGPRLPGDPGHASQRDIDAMFADDARSPE